MKTLEHKDMLYTAAAFRNIYLSSMSEHFPMLAGHLVRSKPRGWHSWYI